MRRKHTRREILAGVATVAAAATLPSASVAEPELSVFDWLEQVEVSASIRPAGSIPQVSKAPDREDYSLTT
jgi:hypothetical protein